MLNIDGHIPTRLRHQRFFHSNWGRRVSQRRAAAEPRPLPGRGRRPWFGHPVVRRPAAPAALPIGTHFLPSPSAVGHTDRQLEPQWAI